MFSRKQINQILFIITATHTLRDNMMSLVVLIATRKSATSIQYVIYKLFISFYFHKNSPQLLFPFSLVLFCWKFYFDGRNFTCHIFYLKIIIQIICKQINNIFIVIFVFFRCNFFSCRMHIIRRINCVLSDILLGS